MRRMRVLPMRSSVTFELDKRVTRDPDMDVTSDNDINKYVPSEVDEVDRLGRIFAEIVDDSKVSS